MDNFKGFEMTNEEAMMVVGARKGKGKMRKFFASLSEEDQAALKADLMELKGSEGWEDLSREERRAAKKKSLHNTKRKGRL